MKLVELYSYPKLPSSQSEPSLNKSEWVCLLPPPAPDCYPRRIRLRRTTCPIPTKRCALTKLQTLTISIPTRCYRTDRAQGFRLARCRFAHQGR
jgi:hypothetical protein